MIQKAGYFATAELSCCCNITASFIGSPISVASEFCSTKNTQKNIGYGYSFECVVINVVKLANELCACLFDLVDSVRTRNEEQIPFELYRYVAFSLSVPSAEYRSRTNDL